MFSCEFCKSSNNTFSYRILPVAASVEWDTSTSKPHNILLFRSNIKITNLHLIFCLYRSSRPDVFCEKGVLKNFAKFTGIHLCQRLFFNKVAGLRPGTLLKKRLWHRWFPVNFAKILRTPFLTEYLWWLLLSLFISAQI